MATTDDFKNHILDAIAAKSESDAAQNFPFRHHLGASLLGHSCERFLFFTFRWVQYPKVDSRVQRIFNRGHDEEDKILNMLRGIGLQISTQTDDGNQHRAQGLPPHVGGSMDGILFVPAYMVDVLGEQIPVECKTHNQNSANKTFKGDLASSYPQHYSQGNIYAYTLKASHFMYVGLNKNTDELYIEFPETNSATARIYIARADKIVRTQAYRSLDKTSELWRCKMCDFQFICKKKQPASARNCRSCQHAAPLADGTWYCSLNNIEIPKYEEITLAASCPHWSSII